MRNKSQTNNLQLRKIMLKLKPQTNFKSNVISTFSTLLLHNKIRLYDLPPEIRLLDKIIYIYAFRASRYFPERYHEDVEILKKDMKLSKAKIIVDQEFLESYKKPYQ